MEKKLRIMIVFLTVIIMVGLLALLPFRLYQRDTDVAKQHARLVSDELSNMIKLTMLTTKEVLSLNPNLSLGVVLEKIDTLYQKFGENQDFEFRVVRSSIIEDQFTRIKGRGADNAESKQVLETGKPVSKVEGAMLSYWSPIRADAECGHCHKDEGKKRIAAGTTLGVVETVFDLTRQKERSIRTIIEITGFLLLMTIVLAVMMMAIIRRNLIQPLRDLTDTLRRRGRDPTVALPKYTTPEMADLIDAIDGQGNGKGAGPA